MNRARFKVFVSYYKPYLRLFFADMFFALLGAAITLVYPMIVRYITNDAITWVDRSNVVRVFSLIALGFLGLALLEVVCNYFISYQGHIMGTMMERDMRRDIFVHYQKLSFSFFDTNKTGSLMSRATNDLFDITELCHHGPEDIVISIIKFFGAFVILVMIDWKLTLILFVFLPMMFFFANYLRKRMNAAFLARREKIAVINSQIENNLSGIRAVKSFANETWEIEKFRVGNDAFLESKKYAYKQMAAFHTGLNFFTNLVSGAVVVGGGMFIVYGSIDVSDLLTFMLYLNNIIEPIRRLINFTEQYQNGITGFSRFMDIMEVEPDIVDSEGAIDIKDIRGDIEYRDVSFGYGDDKMIFEHISMQIPSGAYIALVGSSGVGKTTFCSLLPRFYEATQGSVLIDGVDVKDISLTSLRKQIGVVQQDVFIFGGTIAENIRYGRLDATEAEVIAAAKGANAHDFIMRTKDGYNTIVGERGVTLSGGQKQLISIARVMLKNPPILILDEATSSLDNESERIVQQSLDRLAKDRTMLVIAHRLSTIRNAGKIVVLGSSGIVEEGSHTQLIAKDGAYAAFYKLGFDNSVPVFQ